MKRKLLTICCLAAAGPATAQAPDWEVTASLSGWFSGLGSTVETRFGEVDAELDFADVWERLDMAFFGSLEARTGSWALITDLIFTDLSSEEDTPFGLAFRSAEVEAQLTLVSAYAAYSVMDTADLRLDLGGGFRYNDAGIDVVLAGNAAPSTSLSFSDRWLDPLIGARLHLDFSQDWFGTTFADIGGFGVHDAADLTWQGYAGIGYRVSEVWALQAGYRHLSIRRDFDGRDITLELGGPMLGVQASF